MILSVKTGASGYDVVIEPGCLDAVGDLLSLDRRVLIVTDDGVPEEYAARAAAVCKAPRTVCVRQGEGSKSLSVWESLLSEMLSAGFTRSDCVVAVGGGVVGDLAGFAAASYMRGIDFYNIPTTLLSQVDSSVGGKTAVNFGGIKNIVGAFYPPKKVLIDPDLLKTLPPRQISNGMAEAIKMAVTCDGDLFARLEADDISLPEVIERSLRIKRRVVEADEKEGGLRRVLNFGHTVGHGIESFERLHGLYHGECVALGMLPMCSPALRARLIPVLKRWNLPVSCSLDPSAVLEAMTHDKKASGDGVTVVTSEEAGSYTLRTVSLEELARRLDYFVSGEDGK